MTLGGNGNGNGVLVILDAIGNRVGYIDNTGVHFDRGVFSGELSGASGVFSGTVRAGRVEGSEISGSRIKSYDEDDNGIENDGGTQRFYWAGTQFGTMRPDSDYIVNESTGEAVETSYLYYNCAIMAKELYNYSDERKKDIVAWDDSYDDFLMDLVPIRFSWKDGTDKRFHTGIGAQATKRLLKKHGIVNSALISGNNKKGLTVDYSDLHPMEIKAIQKNRKMILELREEIQKLKQQLKNGG